MGRTGRCHTRGVRAQAEADITDVVVEQARRLGEGGYRLTGRQLYYAVCAALARPAPPPATKGIFGTGLLLIVIAGIVSRFHPPVPSLILVGVGGVLVLLAPVNARVERRHALVRAREPRPLALSWPSFAEGPLERVAAQVADLVIAAPPPDGYPTGPRHSGSRAERGPVIACDREETAALLRANAGWLPGGTAVVAVPADTDPRALRGRRVVALHDADPAGCALPARLRAAGVREVADAGLPPPPSDGGLQVLEGAPARVPEGLEGDLSPEQIAWLRSGRRLELATLGPRAVVERVVGAAERLERLRERVPLAPAPASQAAAAP